MNRRAPTRRTALMVLSAMVAIWLPGCQPAGSSRISRPDVVLIVLDALRVDRLSLYGYGRKTTPNLEIARRQLRVFTNAITPAPQTAPTMASIFTGVPPRDHGLQFDSINHVFMVGSERVHTPLVSPAHPTLAERFRDAGYATFGASTNPWIGAAWGYGRGFDTFVGWKEIDPELPSDGRRVVDRIGTWLDAAPGSPRFIYAHFMDVHAPFRKGHNHFVTREGNEVLVNGKKPVAPADLRYMNELYDSNVRYADALIAKLFARLDAAERPYVAAIVADHGDEFLEHGGLGHGTSLYDELLRVPVIFRGANVDRYGTSSFPLQLTDVHDLLLGAAGLEEVPLFGLLSTTAPEPAEPDRLRASEFATVAALRRGTWKYIVQTEPLTEELYNLAEDPGERRNVADRERAVMEGFREDAAELWPKRFPLWAERPPQPGAPPR